MKTIAVLMALAACGGAAFAQSDAPTESTWRSTVMGLPEHPSENTSPADITRFEQSLMYAGPYFATLKPGDWEANRELARRMAVYMAGLGGIGRDPQLRIAVGRARRTMWAMRMVAPGFLGAYPGMFPAGDLPTGPAPQPVNPGRPQPPPFAVEPPALSGVAAADNEVAIDLTARYRASAGHAAAAWKNAEELRMRLATEGMAVNDDIAASLARLQMDLTLAAGALSAHDWTEAQANLERAEYETHKLEKSVGG